MHPCLRVLTTPVEDTGSVPGTHMVVVSACNSSTRATGGLFWPPAALYAYDVYKLTQANTHTLK